MDIRFLLSDLDPYGNIGIVHFHLKSRERFEYCAACLGGKFGRFQRKCFIRTLCLALECLCAVELIRKIFGAGFQYGVKRLFARRGACDRSKAEHLLYLSVHIVKGIDRLAVLRLYKHRALSVSDRIIADMLCAPLYLSEKKRFKVSLVCALQYYFTVFAKNYFLHIRPLSFRKRALLHLRC